MNRTRSAGFTLLEAMIVLVVVGVVAAISLDMLTGQARAEARRQMVSQQATEMATINRAVGEWVNTATGLPTTAGQVMEVNLQNIVTAGRLPADFARRAASGTNNPVSPLGQPYRAFIRRTATGSYEIVSIANGAPNAAFAARAGISNNTEAQRTWGVAVMHQIRERFTIPSGVVNAGTSTIDAAASGFAIDLQAFLGGNTANAAVAALSNFTALQATPTPPSGQQASSAPRECYHEDQNASSLTCAEGYQPFWQYTLCSDTGGISGRTFSTPLGGYRIQPSTAVTSGVPDIMSNLSELLEQNTAVYQGVSSPPQGSQWTSNCPGGWISSDIVTVSGSWGHATGWNFWCSSGGMWLTAGLGDAGRGNRTAGGTASWAGAAVYGVPPSAGFQSTPSGRALGFAGYVTEHPGHRFVHASPMPAEGAGYGFTFALSTGGGGGGSFPNISQSLFHLAGSWTYAGERAACSGSTNARPVHVFVAPTSAGGFAVAHSVQAGAAPVTATSGTDSVITPSNGTVTHTCGTRTLTNAASSGVTTNACPVVAGVRGLVTAQGSSPAPRTVGVCCR